MLQSPYTLPELNQTSLGWSNAIYNFDGSIMPAEGGPTVVRLVYGYSTSATLLFESVTGGCVLDPNCYLSKNITCNATQTLNTQFYFRLKIQFQISGSCSNNYIRLEWKRFSSSVFELIPSQYLCQAPFDSSTSIPYSHLYMFLRYADSNYDCNNWYNHNIW